MDTEQLDIAIIGAGPAGLGAAMELKRRGLSRLVVLEREAEVGGIPRHCGHPPFGWREYRRIMTGPGYAKRLAADAVSAGIDIQTRTTVTGLRESGMIEVTSPAGCRRISAKRVILATGGRETPRAARLIGGTRPAGVLNTGALQSMVYRHKRIPFRRPVILGSELVSFSAVLTCRKAGIRPVAIVEELSQTVAPWPCELYPLMLGIPIYRQARVHRIVGTDRVEAVELRLADGSAAHLASDGLLLTGQFIPEASLLRASHLAVDTATAGPQVDQNGRMSDPAYYAAGNVLRPIETAGWSWHEGRIVASAVADDLKAPKPGRRHVASIAIAAPIKLAVPQVLAFPANGAGLKHLQLRVQRPVAGELQIRSGGAAIWRRRINTRPERRLLVPIESFIDKIESSTIVVDVKEDRPQDRAAGDVD